MSSLNTEREPDPREREFKDVFGDILDKAKTEDGKKLTQREAARVLAIDESTVARVLAGTRRPPRNISFYEGMRNLPGIEETDIAQLMLTKNAPRWLVADESSPRQPEPVTFGTVARVPGVRAHITVSFDPRQYEFEDGQDIANMLRSTAQLSMRQFLRARQRQQLQGLR